MTITMPQGKWIPNTDQITDSAAGLLAVMGDGLDRWGLGEPFTRRVFSHGAVVPLQLGDSPQAQLLVAFISLELGNAGQKQFQFAKGDIGAYAHMVGQFQCELWVPWPQPTGGIGPSLAQDRLLMEAATNLNECAWVVFSCLRSLALGGTGSVRADPPVTPIQQDGIMVGPMRPAGPSGSMSGYQIDVQLQYT